MHRSAACQELIADSVMAEAEFEEPNLFTLHATDNPLYAPVNPARPTDAVPEADSEPLSPQMPAIDEHPDLILVHGGEGTPNEPAPEKAPNTAAILQEGWPWVDETAEAVDILLEGVDFSDVCPSPSVVPHHHNEQAAPAPGDSLFPHDDHSATQDIIQCHPAAGGNTMNDTGTDNHRSTPATPEPLSENAPKPSIVTHAAGDHDLGEMARLGDEPTLGEPVISDVDMAALRDAIDDRQATTSASSLFPDTAPDKHADSSTSARDAKMRPMPTLPAPGSIAKLGEQKIGTAPKRIGSGRLVPARLTWKPGDPFAGTVERYAKRRFRWEVMLTSASITAASGMGCAWLLRAIFA